MSKIRVLYIFRRPSADFHSIENLFSSIQTRLPEDIQHENLFLPYHEGVLGKIKNILFVLKKHSFFRQFDLIHITGDITYITPFIRGEKIVTYHDLGSLFADRGSLTRKILNLLWLRWPVRSARKITIISPSTAKEVKDLIPGAETKLVYIPNCISDEWLSTDTKQREKVRYILTVGTKKNKNLERIIRACQDTEVCLIIVGKLSDEQQKLLNNCKLEYVVWTNLQYKQIYKLYLQSDIVMFPSLYEGFGLPILEAQAIGRPLITSDIEPMSSVAGRGALKVDPLYVEQLCSALLRLIESYSLRQELVKLGRLNVDQYKCSRISHEYAKLYRNLTQK